MRRGRRAYIVFHITNPINPIECNYIHWLENGPTPRTGERRDIAWRGHVIGIISIGKRDIFYQWSASASVPGIACSTDAQMHCCRGRPDSILDVISRYPSSFPLQRYVQYTPRPFRVQLVYIQLVRQNHRQQMAHILNCIYCLSVYQLL